MSPLVSDDPLIPRAIAELLAAIRENPKSVKFADAMKVAEHFFGRPRQRRRGSSHYVFKMPWPGNPRINLQDAGGAKAYQVRQLLDAIEKLQLQRANTSTATSDRS